MNNPLLEMEKMRRAGDLAGARRLGEDVCASGNDSPELVRLLLDIYLDIRNECTRSGVTSIIAEIDSRVDELLLECRQADRQAARYRALKLAELPGYDAIKGFDNLSLSAGHEEEAYNGVRSYMELNPVDPRFHEMVATILFRYLRADYGRMESITARRLLADYLALTVPRPSRLNSLMLRMAVRIARKFPDFNFVKFLCMWNPATMRPEDMPALATAALACVIDSPQASEFGRILELLPCRRAMKKEILCSAIRYLVKKAIKENDSSGASDLLSLYAAHESIHEKSAIHSEMLSLALRVMNNEHASRFPEFFVNWDPAFLRPEDFVPVTSRNGDTISSVATRAMSRCFSVIKNDVPRFSHLLPRVMQGFDSIAALFPEQVDELFERRVALMLAWIDCDDSAIDRFSSMARRPEPRSARFWLDFADVVNPRQLKMGIVALGIIRTNKVDDIDISELRLTLAQLLHFEGEDSRASLELKLYIDELTAIAAEPSARYGAIAGTVNIETVPNISNELLYHTLAAEALEMIYNRFPRRLMCVLGVDGDRMSVSDGSSSSPVSLSLAKWPVVRRLRPGDNLSVRFDNEGRPVAVLPVDDVPYASLPDHYGCVVATAPVKVHCAGKYEPILASSETPLANGMTVRLKVYHDEAGRRSGIVIGPVTIEEAAPHFSRLCVAVYERHPDGTALYTVGPDEPGGEIPPEMASNVGDFVPFDIYYYSTADGLRHVIHIADSVDPDECAAIKQVSGPLAVNPDGAFFVRDVAVPRSIPADEKIEDMTFVTCTAIYLPSTPSRPPVWTALNLHTYR